MAQLQPILETPLGAANPVSRPGRVALRCIVFRIQRVRESHLRTWSWNCPRRTISRPGRSLRRRCDPFLPPRIYGPLVDALRRLMRSGYVNVCRGRLCWLATVSRPGFCARLGRLSARVTFFRRVTFSVLTSRWRLRRSGDGLGYSISPSRPAPLCRHEVILADE